ncbi:MAG: S8 family peptidase [Bacteroidales bacterium]|nr:S8 family peptidase [Bacteroidales bacterium]
MRRVCLIVVVCAFCFFSMKAQMYYYTAKGQRVSISEDYNKVAVFISKGMGESLDLFLKDNASVECRHQLNDKMFDVRIYQLADEKQKSKIKSFLQGKGFVYPCYRTNDTEELILSNYINVALRSQDDYDILLRMMEKYKLTFTGKYEGMPLWYQLSVTSESAGTSLEIANAMYETGSLYSSQPDFTMNALECTDDPYFDYQWGLNNLTYENIDMSVCDAWSLSTGCGTKIAIVDQGVDLNHKDLLSNIYYLSYDAETDSYPSVIYGDHGVHCAGIAAAIGNNGIFISGVAPDAQIVSISKDFEGSQSLNSGLARGINWAWRNGADIISCSWRTTQSDLLETAIDSSLERGRCGLGCVFVKSAGNTSGAVSYPGDYRSEVLTVGSIQKNGTKASNSCYGAALDVMAPGVGILSTILNDTIGIKSGTSMAAPHAAGLASLILGINPKFTGQQVRDIIESTTKKIGPESYNIQKGNGTWNNKYGYGLINAYAAVKKASEMTHYYIQDTIIGAGEYVIENVFNISAGYSVTNTEDYGDVIIEPGSNVIFKAKEKIRLRPGFHAKPGSFFWASIESDNNRFTRSVDLSSDERMFIPSKEMKEEERIEVFDTIPIGETNTIYPNPTKGKVFLNVSGEITCVKVYNTKGQCVIQTKSTEIDFSDLSAGLYYIHAIGENTIFRGKIIHM